MKRSVYSLVRGSACAMVTLAFEFAVAPALARATCNPPVACIGDCHGEGSVTIDEILIMVNIALGNSPVSGCMAGDANCDGSVTVDEIVTAAINALDGCPAPADADLGGIWFGTLTYGDQSFDDLVGLTTADGRFTLISLDTFGPDTFGQYIGTATVDGANVTGSGRAYAALGATWNNGSTVLDTTIAAVIDERSSMSGTWETSSGDAGSFELQYDPEYERDSSLALLEGVWYVHDALLTPTLTVTVETSGSFTAQSSLGCQSRGQISIINAAYNIYGWDVTISNCAIAGDYSGFAVLGDVDTGDPANSQNNALLVSISNDQRAILLPLER